jgi:hypothetical protein
MFTRSPERLAWITLLSSFAIFLCLSLSGLLVVRWFLFESTANLRTEVRVGRGTVGVQNLNESGGQQAVRINRTISRDDLITTDEIAQGDIQLIDTSNQDRVIGNVVILPGSQVKLASATRPRFHLGNDQYEIELVDFEGRLEIEIPANLPRAMNMQVKNTNGTFILREAGMFLLWSLPNEMIVVARSGDILFTPLQSQSFRINSGQKMVFNIADRAIRYEVIDELFPNPLFNQSTELGVPDSWGCYSFAENPDAPRGSISLFTLEGRRSMVFHRQGQNIGFGETACRQPLGDRTAGLDVTKYETLRIRATMEIRWQSLGICGSQGSECPVMLELTYLNELGIEQRWIHGFYAFEHGDTTNLPRACDSCLIEHERLTPGNWYTYESGNLFDLPEGFRPTKLKQIRFYASGHEYEVAIGEVSLLGEPPDNP